MVLSTQRQIGMSGPQPIGMGDVLAYCEFEGIRHPDDRDDFLHHVQKMDLVFLADWKARNPSPKKGSHDKPRLGG